jgi:hypothetical protein
MTSFVRRGISGPTLAGAACMLLAWGCCAPAQAGCSHLVSSRLDRAPLPSFLQGTMSDQARGPARPEVPSGLPQAPAPCRGALCSGSPAVPAVPAGVIRIGGDLWAVCAPMPDSASPGLTFLASTAGDLRPIGRPAAIFHPPRPALSPA